MTNSNTAWPLSTEQIDQIIGWVRQAGHIALRYFRYTAPHLKMDQTFVTQADLEIEQFLAEQIRTTFPHHSLIAEEQRWGSIDVERPIWVLDPLDGTTAFAQGLPGWGISLGLLYQSQPSFGLFYMPLTNDLTYTNGQGDVYANEHHLRGAVRQDWSNKGFLAVGANVHREFQLNVPKIRVMGSIGANLAYTARGAAAAALISKAYLWDLVAGAAILARNGGELCYLSGAPVDYGELLDGQRTTEPIIAGHGDILTELQGAIWPLDIKLENFRFREKQGRTDGSQH